jgi:uncharacterized sulfatase
LKFLLPILLLALAPFACGRPAPNIVMVLIDDMGWSDFSCFGNTEAKTPNIDKLAAEGLSFRQFYVNSPICSPSRCALLTGQYPQRWKITSFLENRVSNEKRGMAQWLDPKAPVMARQLKAGGYATGHFGKWHLGGQRDVDDAPPISTYGFDSTLTNFEGMGPKLLPLTMKPGETQPGRIWQNAERLGGPATWMQRSQITGGFVDAAIPFIEKAVSEKKPFQVNLFPDDVHSPYWPPVEKWAEGKRAMYLAVLENMDRQLGKLFDHIRDNPGLRDNTIVLVCSDNGPEPGGGSAKPLRGSKGTLYEGGIRSPLIVWAPGWMAPEKVGKVNDTSVFAAFDLAPSLLKLAGQSPAEGTATDGEDLSAVLLGKDDSSRKAPIFWRRPPDRKNTGGKQAEPLPDLAVRDGKWKLLCNYDGSSPQLYDLVADASESTDLASTQSGIVARLSKPAADWHLSLPEDKGGELGRTGAGKTDE